MIEGIKSINLKIFSKDIPDHLLTAISAWISRVITAGIQILSIRILLESLGAEQYAVFVLLSGLMGWYLLTDMGIGVSLQNFISELRAKGQPYESFISASGIIALFLFLVMTVLLYLLSSFYGPVFLKRYGFLNQIEKIKIFYVVGLLYTCSSIGGISYKIWFAQQKGYLSNIIPAIGSLFGFAGILFLAHSDVKNKLFMSLLAFLLPTAILSCLVFVKQILYYQRGVMKFSKIDSKMIFKRAFKFWFFALMAAAVLQVDYIIMSQFMNTEDIIKYNISTKIFYTVTFIYTALLASFWPVCTEMATRQDWSGIKKQIIQYIVGGLVLMTVSTMVIVIFMPDICHILSPSKNLIIPTSFLLLLGFSMMIRVWTDTFSMVLQSMSDLRTFWIWVPIQAGLNVYLQWKLAPIVGIYGIVLSLIISFLLTVSWALPYRFYLHLKRFTKA